MPNSLMGMTVRQTQEHKMNTVSLTIEMPDDLIKALGEGNVPIEQEIRLCVITTLFQIGRAHV